ncbi:MAG: hypothetical protein JSR99_18845 [Proteobacteria bacterium]|nr:hypothetical protein [Pseudomonadota bacterium]
MTFSRPILAFSLSLALSMAAPGIALAQDLSEASLSMNSGWAGGYMGLGGNLGQAIVRHHRAKAEKPIRNAKAARPQHREARVTVTKAKYERRTDTPVFLIARALDQTGLNIGMLRTSTRGP